MRIIGAFVLVTLASPAWGAKIARPAPETVKEIDSRLVACGTRHSMSSWTDPKRGIGCARDYIAAEFTISAAGNPNARVVVDKFEASSARTRDVPAPFENVYLVIEGSDPVLKSTAFFVSGHYDSICSDPMDATCDAPGADDDASGTTVTIIGPKLIAGRDHRATIVFAALAGEELGLLGGKRLVVWAKERGLTVGGVLNNDIVGATNGSRDRRPRVFCDDDAASPARHLGLWLDEFMGSRAVRLIFRKDRFARGGDHLPFVEAGAPAVRFTEPKEDYRHQHQNLRTEDGVEYGDLQKFMDFKFLAEVARINAEAVSRLANAPIPPTSAIAEGAVKPDTTVTFEAAADAERNGFEILTRDTTAARWKVATEAQTAGTVTLPGVRIDDAMFAVRSVGKNGERSIAVEAKPQARRAGGVPPPTPPAVPPAK